MNDGAALRKSLAEIDTLELSNVKFGPFHIQTRFCGEWNVSVRIDRAFVLQTPFGNHTFDVVTKEGEAGSLLIRLIGRRARFSYHPDSFIVTFDNGDFLTVPLLESDFDPLQIYCAHHMTPSKLAWGFTVIAGMQVG